MSEFIIESAPDYLPLTSKQFVRHFSNLLYNKNLPLKIDYSDFIKIFGYSCRSLFDLCMQCFGDDVVIAATPLHHTSYRDIIEEHVQPENIHVIPLNKNYNGIGKIPELEKCDLVVVTHLFGQDIDLNKLKTFKKKHNCIILEDRVQGGSLDKRFSSDIVDIALYSMGMDKRPIALGGGYLHLRKNQQAVADQLLKFINELPIETRKLRFKELVKKIPTYLLYNSKFFYFLFISFVNLLKQFIENIDLVKVAKTYRKKNPGFLRSDILKKPSAGLMKSMYENLDYYGPIEKRYIRKYKQFSSLLPKSLKETFFPWYKDNYCLSSYNTIYIESEKVDDFLYFMDHHLIATIANPTYKLFNKSYKGMEKDIEFNDGIVYLPSQATMTRKEMKQLIAVLQEFYNKYY